MGEGDEQAERGGDGRQCQQRERAGAYRLLEIVIEVGDGITRPDAGESSGFAHTGGTFKAYLGDLKRARLVDERDGLIVPNPILWPEEVMA